MSATLFAFISCGGLCGFIVLLVFERRRGRRVLEPIRHACDVLIDRFVADMHRHVPTVNHNFFRQLMHYFVHRVLTRLVRTLRGCEGALKRVMRLNRAKAVGVVVPNPDSHLEKLKEHKIESSLSPEEKVRRKREAILGKV